MKVLTTLAARTFLVTWTSLLSFSAFAAASESVTSIAGNYSGYAYNGQNLDPVLTMLAFDENGRFMGSYKVDDENNPFQGTLSGLIQEDDRTYSMQWTDKDGEGFVYMEFSADYSSFSGFWTDPGGEQQFPWNGRRQ